MKVTFTVMDPDNQPLARFSRNAFWNILRTCWRCTTPEGEPICCAEEDSIILAILRRFLGTMFGLLRTNVVIVAGANPRGELLGELWRLFISMFLHSDPEHLLGNMVPLFILGAACEHACGSGKATAIYLAAGVATAAIDPHPTGARVGGGLWPDGQPGRRARATARHGRLRGDSRQEPAYFEPEVRERENSRMASAA